MPFPGRLQHFIFIAFYIGSVNKRKQFYGFFLYTFAYCVLTILTKIFRKPKNSQ